MKSVKTIYALVVALLAISFHVNAQESDIISQANKAYNANQFEEALKLYTTAIDSLGGSSDLYYNLGNAQYRTGNTGLAIVAYERALKFDPTNADARANLGFLNSKIIDRPGERGTLVSQATDALLDLAGVNAWAWLTFILFLITIGCVAVYVMSSSVTIRKAGFFGGIVMLILTCLGIILAIRAGSRVESNEEAIVTVSTTTLSTEPSTPTTEAEQAGTLHEGAKVEIVDSIVSTTDSTRMWLDVNVDNSTRAWINADDVERI